MTLSITIAGVDVTSRVDVVNRSTGIESAADGTYAESTLILDDVDGSLTIEQWSEVIITESACAQPRLYTGYVTAAKATREDFTTGAGRVWTLALADLNVLIGNQSLVFHAADANRPLESFNTRMAWLLASPQMTRVHDNGFVTSSTANYGESDYRKEYPDSVLQDLSVTSNRNRVYFVYWDPVAAQASLFIDNPAVALHTSTLALSNVRADIDNTTTFAPHQDAELDQDGSEMVDGALLTWKAGQTYYANHDGRFPGGYHRDASIETDRIGQATTAYNHAANYVAAHAVPIDTITCRVRIPCAQVTLIEAGMRIAVRFSHFPGYTSSTYIRVAHRTVDLKLAPNNQYDVDLILNERGVTAPGGGAGGFPLQTDCTMSLSATADTICGGSSGGGGTALNRSDLVVGTTYSISGTFTNSSIGTYSGNIGFGLSPTGCYSAVSYLPEYFQDGMTGYTLAAGATQTFTGTFTYDSTIDALFAADGGVAYLHIQGAHSPSTPVVPGEQGTMTITVAGCGEPPRPGQWVYGEVVATTAGAGTTAWPYAAGSLIVRVDGVVISRASYTETDNTTGAFTLSWTPDSSEVVTVDYQGI